MTYKEKLLDPRWQKKRLEIFERDRWFCKFCGADDKTLHIHHLVYENNKEPWEVSSDNLVSLCEECHKKEYEERKNNEEELLEMLRIRLISSDDIFYINMILQTIINNIGYPPEVMDSIIEYIFDNNKNICSDYFKSILK